MKTVFLGSTTLQVPALALGCMRMKELDETQSVRLLETCLELGVNYFDHADIYGGPEDPCEVRFAKAFQKTGVSRDRIILQSKLGIVPGKMYDHSRDYILSETDLILRRLNTDYLDVLLLHRPDALMEPDEVAEAFDRLEQSGKVRFFGVSNHKTSQIQLLKKAVRQPLVANQLQLSIPFSSMISSGLEANMATDGAVDRDDSILDYCRLHGITIQAWSPYQAGRRKGPFIDSPEYPELNRVLEELACKYGSTKTGIAAAWIFRHPARMQVIAGSMREDRIREIAQAADIEITREEWYRLYLAAGHILP